MSKKNTSSSTKGKSQSSKLDIEQIKKNNYASAVGVWVNAEGDELIIDDNGYVTPDGLKSMGTQMKLDSAKVNEKIGGNRNEHS